MKRLAAVPLLLAACVTANPTAAQDVVEHDDDARSAEIDELQKLLALSAGQPDEPKLLFRLAEEERKQSQLDTRQALERETLADEAKQRNNPTVADAQRADAETLKQRSQKSALEAIAHLEQVVTRFPRDPLVPAALFALAYLQAEQHQDDRAQANLDRLLSTYPSAPEVGDAHVMRGDALFEKGQMEPAISEYDAAATTPSKVQPYAIYKRAWCAFNLSRFSAALADFTTVMAGSNAKLATEAAKDWVRAWAMNGGSAAAAKAALDSLRHPVTTKALLERLASTYQELGRDADASEARRLAQ